MTTTTPLSSATIPPDPMLMELVIGGQKRRLYIPHGSMDDCRAIFDAREYPTRLFRHAHPEVILDIGGHVGFASLFFHTQYPTAKIHSFEPIVENQRVYRQNLDGLPQVQLHPYGLGESDEIRTIYLSRRFGLGASSVVKTRDHEGETTQIELREATQAIRDIVAPGNPISILKIDTEGFEFVILERLRDWLPSTDVIFLEVHSERRRRDIDQLLSPWFQLRHCEVPFGHRIKELYLNSQALEVGRVATVQAPDIFI